MGILYALIVIGAIIIGGIRDAIWDINSSIDSYDMENDTWIDHKGNTRDRKTGHVVFIKRDEKTDEAFLYDVKERRNIRNLTQEKFDFEVYDQRSKRKLGKSDRLYIRANCPYINGSKKQLYIAIETGEKCCAIDVPAFMFKKNYINIPEYLNGDTYATYTDDFNVQSIMYGIDSKKPLSFSDWTRQTLHNKGVSDDLINRVFAVLIKKDGDFFDRKFKDELWIRENVPKNDLFMSDIKNE